MTVGFIGEGNPCTQKKKNIRSNDIQKAMTNSMRDQKSSKCG